MAYLPILEAPSHTKKGTSFVPSLGKGKPKCWKMTRVAVILASGNVALASDGTFDGSGDR